MDTSGFIQVKLSDYNVATQGGGTFLNISTYVIRASLMKFRQKPISKFGAHIDTVGAGFARVHRRKTQGKVGIGTGNVVTPV